MVAAIEPLLLKARDAAKALALSERTLWTMTKTGQIPRIQQGRANAPAAQFISDQCRLDPDKKEDRQERSICGV